jgi:hypothetical protein
MRKTLLIAAATLAAGVIAAQADSPVYSQNIVGYVNTVLPGGSLTLISNPLLGPNGTNDAEQVLSSLVGGETLFIWNNHGYYAYTYNGAGVGTGLGFASDWTDLNGGTATAVPGDTYDSANQVYWTQPPQLPQGVSAFLQNPGSTITNSFVGTVVLASTNSIPGNNATAFVASTLPIGGDLENTNFNLPFVGGETVLVWNNHGYYAYTYNGAGVGTGLGFASDWTDLNGGTAAAVPGDTYDSVNQVYWTPVLTIGVGTGFLIQNPGSTLLWKQNLTIQ